MKTSPNYSILSSLRSKSVFVLLIAGFMLVGCGKSNNSGSGVVPGAVVGGAVVPGTVLPGGVGQGSLGVSGACVAAAGQIPFQAGLYINSAMISSVQTGASGYALSTGAMSLNSMPNGPWGVVSMNLGIQGNYATGSGFLQLNPTVLAAYPMIQSGCVSVVAIDLKYRASQLYGGSVLLSLNNSGQTLAVHF